MWTKRSAAMMDKRVTVECGEVAIKCGRVVI